MQVNSAGSVPLFMWQVLPCVWPGLIPRSVQSINVILSACQALQRQLRLQVWFGASVEFDIDVSSFVYLIAVYVALVGVDGE